MSPKTGTRRLSELKGLGKDIWETVNVDEYIEQERSAWGG